MKKTKVAWIRMKDNEIIAYWYAKEYRYLEDWYFNTTNKNHCK